MTRFFRWVYWVFFDLRIPPSIGYLLRERAALHEELEIIQQEISKNERRIHAATLRTGRMS
jgi:hypothetical protein